MANLPYDQLLALQDIANKWSEVCELVPRRDQTLQQEMMRQDNNERLRRQFAAKANVVGQWLETQLDAVASIGVQMRGSLEEQLKKLQAFDKAIIAYKPNIEELEKYNQVWNIFDAAILALFFFFFFFFFYHVNLTVFLPHLSSFISFCHMKLWVLREGGW